VGPHGAPLYGAVPPGSYAPAIVAGAVREGAPAPEEDARPMPRLLVGLERVFGLNAWMTNNPPSGNNEGSSNGISVSALLGAGSPDAVPALAYHIPRGAVDYVFKFHLTLGLAGGVFAGNSRLKNTDGTTTDGPGLFLYVVEPRVGYVFALGKHVALWPRAGFSFYGFSESGTTKSGDRTSASITGMAIDLEPTFVFRPSKYTGVTASLLGDLGIQGKQNGSLNGTSNGSGSVTALNAGVTFGGYVAF
jgi:hypothetical protein